MATIFGERLAALAAGASPYPAWVEGDREVAFDEIVAEVAAFAACLVEEGVARSPAVGVSIADDRRNAVAGLALFALGVPQVMLPTTDPAPLRESLAARLNVDRVLAESPADGLDGAPALVVPPPGRYGGAIRPIRDDPDGVALYVTSSGTTGRPKLLPYTQRGIAIRSASAARDDGHGAGERIYVAMRAQNPLARMVRFYAFLQGATSVLHDGGTTAADIVDRCLSARVTTLYLSALQATSLAGTVAVGDRSRLDASVKVFSSASRLPTGTTDRFERVVGGRLFDRYGATEVGVLSSTYPGGDEGIPDGVGRLVSGVHVEIVDELDDVVPPGIAGTIRARTPQMISGYVDDPELSDRHFRDGWFYPGDMGAFTEEGVLRFLGRRDDMLSLGGINIFPSEIERVLEAHPAVRACAAFPVRSKIFGEIPLAAVELRTPDAAGTDALLAYARERLGVRAPRRIVVLDALPRNAAGKVLKSVLADRCAQEPATRDAREEGS